MSVCRCTDTEVCFPCREREAHEAVGRHSVHGVPLQQFYSPVYTAPRVYPPLAEAPDVEPATDEQIARDEARAKDGAVTGAHRTLALIARLRQTEERFETAVRWAERLLRTVDEKKDERDEARAEAARLREQVVAYYVTERDEALKQRDERYAEVVRLRDAVEAVTQACRRRADRADAAEAEAARLRERVAAMQAADAGAFW